MSQEKQINLICKMCGADFTRPEKYKEWQKKSPNVHWKWMLMYCDECRKKRIEQALNKLPEFLRKIIDGQL